MKKIVALLLVVILLISMSTFLVGCGKKKSSSYNDIQKSYDDTMAYYDRMRKDLDDYSKLYDKVFGNN